MRLRQSPDVCNVGCRYRQYVVIVLEQAVMTMSVNTMSVLTLMPMSTTIAMVLMVGKPVMVMVILLVGTLMDVPIGMILGFTAMIATMASNHLLCGINLNFFKRL